MCPSQNVIIMGMDWPPPFLREYVLVQSRRDIGAEQESFQGISFGSPKQSFVFFFFSFSYFFMHSSLQVFRHANSRYLKKNCLFTLRYF